MAALGAGAGEEAARVLAAATVAAEAEGYASVGLSHFIDYLESIEAGRIDGKADPLVPYACGEDTARRIRGAKLIGVEGMGHDLPPGVVERLLEPLIPHLRAA